MSGKGADQMHHLKWKDRTTGAQEEDLFLFPDEQTIEKVDTGRPDDRVYLLQFKNGKRHFFWSQEFDEEAEKEKVELLILKSYVPEMMTDMQVKALVEKAIKEVKASGLNDIGKVMPFIMKEGGATIDGNKARKILKQLLE